MDGFKLNDVADVYVGSVLAKQVYVGNTKVWDYKTPPVYVAPVAKSGLVFTGSPQELLNPGSTMHGTIQYSSNGGTTWSTVIPTSTDANERIEIYWRLIGDNRHNDIPPTLIIASIGKADLTITAKDQSIQWGNSIEIGVEQVTTDGLVLGDSLTAIALTPSTSDLTTTGTITPNSAATTKGASNYNITYKTGRLTIVQRAITISAKAQSVVYGTAITTGVEQVTISGSGLVTGNSLESISLVASRTTVGDGTITPSAAIINDGTADVTSNYNITYNTGALTITQKALTISANAQTISFGDSIATGVNQATAIGLVEGDTLTAITLVASTSAVTTNGTITPSAAIIDNGAENYNITYSTGKLIINKRAVAITAKAQTINYGATITQGIDYVTTSSLGRLTLSSIVLSQSTTEAGTGTIIPSDAVILDGSSDVTSSCIITYDTGVLTINKVAAVKTNPTRVNVIYNGNAQDLAVPGTSEHGVFTYKLSTESVYSNTIPQAIYVGNSYTVEWKFTPDGNHTGTDSGSFTSIISAKTLVITANDQSITFGDSIVAGVEQVTVSGLISGDTLTEITLTPSTSEVTEDGTITPSGAATTRGAENYDITYNTGTLVISKRAIVITAKEQSVTFGTAITTGTGQVTTSNIGPLTLSEITLTPSTSEVTTDGTITPSEAVIKRGTENVTSSCILTYRAGRLTITKKTLIITAKKQTIIYGSPIATGTGQVTANGLISGDTLTSITLTPSTTNVPGGTIMPSGAVCIGGITNYDVTYEPGDLTIKKVTPTVIAPTPLVITYDGTEHALCTEGSTDYGELQYRIGTSGNWSVDVPTAVNHSSAVDGYEVYYRVEGNSNINSIPSESTGFGPVKCNINEKQITATVILSQSTYVYDGTERTPSVTVKDGNTVIPANEYTVSYSNNINVSGSGSKATVTISDNADGNYNVIGSATFTITARPITITASSASKTYDGTALTSNSATAEETGTNRGLASGHTMTSCTVIGTITANGSTNNVASNAVIKSGNVDVTSNYNITYVNGTLTVSAKTLTITAKAQIISYGDSIATGIGQVIVNGLVSGDFLTGIVLVASTTEVTASGIITPSAAVTTNGASNYSITYNTGSLTINKRAITITAKAQTVNYGTPISQGVNYVTASNLGDFTLASISLSQSTSNAGTGTITPSAASIKKGNTDVTGSCEITYNTGTLTINQVSANVTVAPTKKTSLTYTGGSQELVNAGTIIGGTMYYQVTITNSKPSSTTGFSSEIPTGTTAGTYYVWYYVKGDSNHIDTNIYNEAISISIAQKTLTITAASQNIVYGNTIISGTGRVTVNGLVSGDSLTAITLSQSTTAVTSSGTVIPSGATTTKGIGNYSVTYNTGTLTITARPIIITASSSTKTYDGIALTSSSATAEVTGINRGLVSGHSMTSCVVTGTITTKGSTNNIASNAVIKSGNVDVTSNYNITYVNGTLTVTAKALTITANNQSITYGTEIGSGTAYVTAVGLVNGDSLTAVTLVASRSTVGSGTITPSGAATTKGISNYDVTYTDGTLTVTAKALTITAKDQSIQWGNSITTGTNKVTVNGLVSGDTLTGITLTPSTSDLTVAGTITPSGATTTNGIGNYAVTYTAGNLTISHRTITITAKAQSVTYGTGIAVNAGQVTISGSGLATGNSLESISLVASRATVGSGTITPSGAIIKNSNDVDVTNKYSIGYSNGTLTITQKALTITAKEQTIVYGETIATGISKVITSGLVSGDSLVSIILTASRDTAGVGVITPSGATTANGIGNYAVTYNTGVLTITKATPIVTLIADQTTYPTIAYVKFYANVGGKVYETHNGLELTSSNYLTSAQRNLNVTAGDGISTNPCTVNSGSNANSWTIYTYFVPTDTSNYESVASGPETLLVSRAIAITGSESNPGAVIFNTSSQTVQIGITGASGTVTYPTTITVRDRNNVVVTGWTCTNAGIVTIPASAGVGSYTVTGTISVAQSANYNSGTASKSWTVVINANNIIIPTPTGATKVYDGTGITGTFGPCTGASITRYRYSTNGSSWTESATNPTLVNAVTLYTQAYYTAGANYTGSGWSGSAKLTVSARPINITASSSSKVYDGTALISNSATAEASGTNRGLVSGHTMTSCTVTGSIINAGSANNVPSAAVIKNGTTNVTSNYDITYVNGTLTVSKYTPVITLSATNRAYNGNALYATAVVNKPTNGVAVKGTIYYGTSSGSTAYSVVYNGSDPANLSSVSIINTGSKTVYAYFVPDSSCSGVYNNSGSVSKTFSISKANISPTINMPGWTYGSTASNPSVSGNLGNGSVGYYYKVSTASDSTYTTTRPSNAGTYTVKAIVSETTNYNGATVTANFTIAKANINLSVSISNWVYGETAQTPSVSGNSGNGAVVYTYLYPGESTYSSTAPGSTSSIGTYTVRATVAETANHNAGTATVNFAIITNFKPLNSDAFITSDGNYFTVKV